jgi:hypothetical protein
VIRWQARGHRRTRGRGTRLMTWRSSRQGRRRPRSWPPRKPSATRPVPTPSRSRGAATSAGLCVRHGTDSLKRRRHHRDPEGNHRPRPGILGLTWSSTTSVLPIPDTMSDRKLEPAACGKSVAVNGGPCRVALPMPGRPMWAEAPSRIPPGIPGPSSRRERPCQPVTAVANLASYMRQLLWSGRPSSRQKGTFTPTVAMYKYTVQATIQ